MPVDVIRTEELVSQGSRDLVSQLRTVIPSFNINTQPISDAATVVRPASLRNLAPDHTLVLVNGKRRHRSAVITWPGNGIADGSQGPDISTIPSIAIRQVEVLRDGAAAQYGSDAIAGVMNFQLKNDPSGGSLEVQTGGFFDANPGNPATCGSGIIGDIKHSCNGIGGHGRTLSVAGNVGFPLGSNGFGNLSMEYGTAAPTNRAIQRQDALDIINAGNTNLRDTAQVWGSPRNNHDLKLFGNFGHLFDDRFQLYGHGNYLSRKVTGGFYFRNPHTRGGVFRGSRLHPISLLNVYNADGEITNFPNPKELDPTESDHRNAIVYGRQRPSRRPPRASRRPVAPRGRPGLGRDRARQQRFSFRTGAGCRRLPHHSGPSTTPPTRERWRRSRPTRTASPSTAGFREDSRRSLAGI